MDTAGDIIYFATANTTMKDQNQSLSLWHSAPSPLGPTEDAHLYLLKQD